MFRFRRYLTTKTTHTAMMTIAATAEHTTPMTRAGEGLSSVASGTVTSNDFMISRIHIVIKSIFSPSLTKLNSLTMVGSVNEIPRVSGAAFDVSPDSIEPLD